MRLCGFGPTVRRRHDASVKRSSPFMVVTFVIDQCGYGGPRRMLSERSGSRRDQRLIRAQAREETLARLGLIQMVPPSMRELTYIEPFDGRCPRARAMRRTHQRPSVWCLGDTTSEPVVIRGPHYLVGGGHHDRQERHARRTLSSRLRKGETIPVEVFSRGGPGAR